MDSEQRRDPLEAEQEEARQRAEQTQSPAEGEGDEAVHPSLGAPPRRDESRPVFRSSQLQRDDEEGGRPLRG